MHDQLSVRCRAADYCKRTTLAFADGTEAFELASVDGEHVTFLRLVAPDLAWRHPGLLARDGAQIETCPFAAAVNKLRQRVG